jgi:pimeloyl-ACP methyl ester carboxylesterase
MLRMLGAVVAVLALGAPAVGKPITETRCYIDGFETPVRCVSISVPLDYAAPQGEMITVTAAIAPSTSARPAVDPLFVFAGGPGQAATGMGPWLNSAFAPARRERDIVLFDIRGTGKSGALDCPFSLTPERDSVAAFKRDAAACAAKVGPKAVFYSSREIVEDIERFRAALGFAKINMWGGSFGTRVAQHYTRRYGARVRAVVLDAATPADDSIFVSAPRYGQAALDRMFDDCAKEKACGAAFPSVRADFEAMLKRAEAEPFAVDIVDPRTGRMQNVVIDRDGLAGYVRGALYAGFTRSVAPYAIAQGARGNFAPLAALGSMTGEWSVETMSLGSMLSILCGEDQHRALAEPSSSHSFGFMRDSYVRNFAGGCSVWPHRPLPAEMMQAFKSDVPAMAISGAADPVTPPAAGEGALKMFGARVHVVIPNGFHTNSSSKCIADLIGSFLHDPATGGRDHACVAKIALPRFVVSPTL